MSGTFSKLFVRAMRVLAFAYALASLVLTLAFLWTLSALWRTFGSPEHPEDGADAGRGKSSEEREK